MAGMFTDDHAAGEMITDVVIAHPYQKILTPDTGGCVLSIFIMVRYQA